jgi:hypothetical protein
VRYNFGRGLTHQHLIEHLIEQAIEHGESAMPVGISRTALVVALIFSFAGGAAFVSRQAGRDARGDSVEKEPAALLARAKEVMRLTRAAESVIHYRAVAASEQNYQSDRSYPPFFSAMEIKEAWLDLQTGAERVSTQTTFPGQGPFPAQVTLTDASGAFALREQQLTPLPGAFAQSRCLSPWAVIRDWTTAGDARFVGREKYRDYERLVLARSTASGEQRLFLDPKSSFPVKLDFEEKHYLWGQRHVEYLWTNWVLSGGVMAPGSSFRLADGNIEISQTTGDVEIVARSAAPASPALPQKPGPAADDLPLFLQPIEPTTVQVGPRTYLLSNPGYTEAVTEVGGDVFLFDATQGEGRSKKDAEIIAKLFPGYKSITVVVTDLAWPHVAGVRYWVANGATIVAHSAARDFLQSVVDRRWTLAPDLLEQRRATAKLKFVGVDAPYILADGEISLHPIDGIGSEVSLMAYLKADRVLWASDYIQTVDEPSAYASEVWRAVRRDGLHPERTAAEHLPLTPWTKIEELQKKD